MENRPLTKAIMADCMEIMPQYPEGFFDLAVVDPPFFEGPERKEYYGSAVSGHGVRRNNYTEIEQWIIPGPAYFKELFRVSKQQIIFGINYFKVDVGPGRIIWDKCNQASSFSDAEIAYCSLHDSTRLFRFMWSGWAQGKSIKEGHIMQGDKRKNEKKIHPTQKPVLLYNWLFSKYAKAGMKILDTHLGSASSRIAAHRLGLDFTGIELDPVMFEDAQNRFSQETAQLWLPNCSKWTNNEDK